MQYGPIWGFSSNNEIPGFQGITKYWGFQNKNSGFLKFRFCLKIQGF